MRSYSRIHPVSPLHGPGVAHEGRFYVLHIEHATLDERRDPSAVCPPEHTHPVYHLLLFTRGRSRFRLGGRECNCEPGTLLLSDPNQPHHFGPVDNGRFFYHEVTFALIGEHGPLTVPGHVLLSLLTGQALEPREYPVLLDRPQRQIWLGRFQALLNSLVRGGRQTLSAAGILLGMLAGLAEELYVGRDAPPEADALEQAADYLREHYAHPIRLGELARQIGLSAGYFSRAFKQRYGLPPVVYQQQLRLAAARTLLLSSGLPSKIIAHRVGFGDVYAFSKAFKQGTGISPMRYRRQGQLI